MEDLYCEMYIIHYRQITQGNVVFYNLILWKIDYGSKARLFFKILRFLVNQHLERRKNIPIAIVHNTNEFNITDRYSNFNRITALVLRLIKNCKIKNDTSKRVHNYSRTSNLSLVISFVMKNVFWLPKDLFQKQID